MRFAALVPKLATLLFRRHYFHAAPFRREALAAIWARCRAAGCAVARHRAMDQLERGSPVTG